ncbi:Hsp20/alpha crystallin family protein [Marispirochaeta sp.]|uniref:Hsp20/alpha crystallin family protein n=1 Tax=Marispirochaeta sp. TaxID=2038653 RepID=UPI0029C85D30|nr:Hsp20/alpha crystallin family protein [Marispirochaeta sp.]
MALVRYRNSIDPWREFERLRDEINDLFDYDQSSGNRGLFDRHVSPALDVIEGQDSFTVMCELPGIEQKDIALSLTGNVLTIKGERSADKEKDKEKVYRQESWSGTFQRTISLPQTVDGDKKADAVLENGILTLTLPKKEEAKPKQISIKVQ